MNDILNPYIAGAPVVEASMFFGREDVFSWIERSLGGKYVDHILVLHGQRRVGKTSVLKQIPNFLPDKYIQVFFDLQGRTGTSLDRFLWWLASEIVRTLKKERDLDILRPDRKAFEDTEYLINEFLPGLRPTLGDHVLLLTFDEFDTLDRPEIQNSLALPLIAYLRRLMEMEGLNFVFSIGSSGDKLENMQASYTDFFKSALYRKISFLTRDDCHRLITKPVEGIIQYERKAVDRIVEITSGHPYFTQLMCHELFALCQKTGGRNITAADVESILGDVIERGTVNLKFVWDEANDLEKWILAGLAQLDDGATQKLSQLLQKQRVRFSESDLNSAVIHLRDKDVITPDNRFIIHLMRMWLQANRPLDRVREELVEVNPIANRYIEIGDEYRDMGQAAQAVESYQQALLADPGNLKAQTSIGTVHLEGRAYPQAAAAFELALRIDDEDVVARTGFCDANLTLADAARKRDEIETAIGFYEKILVVNPAHADARQRLADIYRGRAEEFLAAGQDDATLSAFNRAMDFTPEDDTLAARYDEVLAQKKAKVVTEWFGKADRSLARQRWDEAAGFVEEALKLDPDNAGLQAKLVEVKDAPRQFKIQSYKREAEQAIKRGNFDKALSALETALQLAPEDQSLTDWLETTRSDQLNTQLNLYRDQAQRAIAAGDWEAAIAARKDALKLSPDDVGLQKALADTQTARIQVQLNDLQSQAEAAIRGGDWDGAVNAYKQAAKLAPEDPAWPSKIKQTETAKLQAQLDTFQKQADEAVSQGQWEAAIQAIKNAGKLAPDDSTWKGKLSEIETARHQAQLRAFRLEADTARAAGKWEAAIAALEGYRKLEPGEVEIQVEIEAIRVEKRQSQLIEFKTQAEKAAKAENWAEAVTAWEKYLTLEPNDREKIEVALHHARKYAKLSADYIEAQEALRKRRYGRAIELLQGVIAQDPSYKSTSRLLVEAVEANKAIPFWRRPWVFWALGAVAVVVLGIFFGPRLWESISTALQRTPPPTLPAELAFLEPVMAYMAETSPDFEDDFSKANPFWGDSIAEDILIADALNDGTLNLELEGNTPREKLVLQSGNMRNITNFGMEFDFYFEGSTSGTVLGVGFESLNDGTNAQVDINLDGQNWFIGLTDGTVEYSGEIDETLKGQWAHLQMFFVDGYLVGFLNGKFLGHAEGINSLKQNVWIYAYSGGQAEIQLDNFKFWNLESVELSAITPAPEPTITPPPTQTAATHPPTATASSPASEPSTFYQPILDYIAGTAPDFAEDFSTEQAYWSDLYLASEVKLKDVVVDGVLHAAGNASDTSAEAIQYNFSIKDLQALEFVLQFDFTQLEINSNTHVYVVFRQDEQNSEYWLALWQSGDWAIEKRDEGVSTQIDSGVTTSYEIEKANTLQIIAKGPTFAILLNDKLLTYFEDDTLSGNSVEFGTYSPETSQYDFDNIKFWNLEGVDLSAVTLDESSLYFHLPGNIGEITSLDWSSDGEYLAITGVWERITTVSVPNKRRVMTASMPKLSYAAWFPGSNWFAISLGNGAIQSVNHATSSSSSLDSFGVVGEGWRGDIKDVGQVTTLRFSADGRRAAAGTENGYVAVWFVSSNPAVGWTRSTELKFEAGAILDLAWNPDGTRISIATQHQGIFVLDSTSLSSSQENWNYLSDSVDWSPDGEYIAVTYNEEHNVFMEILTPDGTIIAHKDVPDAIAKVRWSPDGSLIAVSSYDGYTRILARPENGTLELVAKLYNEERVAIEVAWSPDSKMLALGDLNGGIWIWDLEGLESGAQEETPAASGFGETALAYLESATPTFEDDFSAADMVWGGNSGGYAIYAMVKDGVLIMHDRGSREDSIPDVPGEIFPTNGLLNASNFALQFDFVFETQKPVDNVAVQFRSYELLFNRNGAWTLYENGDSSQTDIDSGDSYLGPQKNTLLVIAYNENLAVYLNGTLVYATNEIALSGRKNTITVTGEYFSEMVFDNVKFWDLEGVDFDTTSSQSESSSPKIDHKSGDIQKSSMDGMDMVYIAAGEFLMGASDLDSAATDAEKPQHKVYLDAYWIDRTEVTNAMFASFLNKMGNQKEGRYFWLETQYAQITQNSQGNWEVNSGYGNHPVVGVSWDGANAYCGWAGRRLPTEAEWEKAARGTDGRKFPWGPIFDCRLLNSDDETDFDANVSERANCDGYASTAPVGNYSGGASPYGVWDMAGNAAEWVSDYFDEDYYSYAPNENPQGPAIEDASGHFSRGGSLFDSSQVPFRTAYRMRFFNQNVINWVDIGFRCVMTP